MVIHNIVRAFHFALLSIFQAEKNQSINGLSCLYTTSSITLSSQLHSKTNAKATQSNVSVQVHLCL
jgi:hypothetical protein